MVAKKVNGGLGKEALGGINEDAIGCQDGEELTKMLEMLRKGRTGNEDIVKIDENKRKVMKKIVHKPLKSLSRIIEAIRHVKVLIEAKRSDDRRLRDVRRMNRDLMISFHQVQLREDGSAMEAGGKVLEVRKRITIRSSGEIKTAVVAASSPGTIRLGDKVKRGRPGTIGTANNSSRFQFIKVCFGLLEARRVKTASLGKNRWTSGVNMMLDSMMRREIFEI